VANHSMAFLDALRKAGIDGDVDFLRESVQIMAEALMEMEVAEKTGAERYQRSEGRTNSRNGYRPTRPWNTRVGQIPLRIPKLRRGSYFPSLLEPRRLAEQALVSVVQEAYVHGVSTRKVDDLVKAMGLDGIDKSTVSRLCKELDGQVERFRQRPLGANYPYMWLDATYLKVRENGRVQGMALVVAIGVKETGEREVLGVDLGPAEDATFWLGFLRSLVARGLRGLQLVISDAHEGLKQAIGAALGGASWQRCTVHFMRNALSYVPKTAQPVVAAAIRTIFAQPDQASARDQLGRVADSLETRFPRVAALLYQAQEDVLAYMAFPTEHHRQIRSTNPLERLNKELKRRADVVGIFPNWEAAVRLMGAVLAEQHDEWAVGRRYFSQESMNNLQKAPQALPDTALLVAD